MMNLFTTSFRSILLFLVLLASIQAIYSKPTDTSLRGTEQQDEEEHSKGRRPDGRHTENPCLLIQKQRQMIIDDDGGGDDRRQQQDPTSEQNQHEQNNDIILDKPHNSIAGNSEWNCETLGKDRINLDKHLVKVDGLQELLDQLAKQGGDSKHRPDHSSGHMILPPDELIEVIDGIINIPGNFGQNKGTNNTTDDDTFQNETSTDGFNETIPDDGFNETDSNVDDDDDVDDYIDESVWEDGINETIGSILDLIAGLNGDDDDDNDSDSTNHRPDDDDDLEDLTMDDDLDDDDDTNSGSNNDNEIDSMSTGSDGFSVSDYNNVFNHTSDNDPDLDRLRFLKNSGGIEFEYDPTKAHKVLVVRVIANDTKTSLTRKQLSNRIFGTNNGDMVNLKERFSKCSYGQTTMEPFSGKTRAHSQVNNKRSVKILSTASPNAGVINVRLLHDVVGANPDDVTEAAITETEKRVGVLSGQFDHVMLCLPPGTSGNWISFGFIHHWLSVFNDDWCASPSAQMHEIGHNLGLGPSIEEFVSGGQGDQSGMMGASYPYHDFPRMCYSPARSWQLGWYPLRRLDVHSSDLAKLAGKENVTELSIRLVGVDDYGVVADGEYDDSAINNNVTNSTSPMYVLAKIHTSGFESKKYYLGFNRKKGMNQDVMDAPDLVTIQAQAGKHHDPAERVATLGINETYTIPSISDDNEDQIVIWVKDINTDGDVVDYADIEISLISSSFEASARFHNRGL